MLFLGIDTSGKTASVALYEDNNALSQYSFCTNRTHSQVILPLCKNMMNDIDRPLSDVDIFCAAIGPGSYTGLRIGISAVKAMAFALNKKCCGISTLESLAYNMSGCNAVVCSIMKARLNLVYTASFDVGRNYIKRLTEDHIATCEELISELKSHKKNIILTGDGADDFILKYGYDNIFIAPPHLKLQLAGCLCLAAGNHEHIIPEMLQASYLQPTKAEKDLCKNNN